MRFIDECKIQVRAGRGGKGSASFHRAKFLPHGGPDGGDGGDGGSVILEAQTGLNTLLDLRYQQRFIARDGEPGRSNQATGASGEDRIVPVPVGTVVRDADTGELLGDLTAPHQQRVVARGGRGGRGNLHFVSSTNRAPRRYDEGEEGEARVLHLELKLIADVGLIGYPNAGKSTLISRISAARPKIADYPFTTLVPSLGVVRVDEERTFVVADIPGLIEGASQGAGLGLKFLRHIERTRVFLHLVSVSELDSEEPPLVRFDKINAELETHNPELLQKPQLVLLTKIDALTDRERELPEVMGAFAARGLRVHPISAVTGEGLRELLFDVARLLESAQQPIGE